ncbi:MAG TPA: glycosyltransferase family 39 protein [Verrucomicrobiae bacterium]|nr:glycosyltransferase family 39 protein [Verrucomicrobiae bacterium]
MKISTQPLLASAAALVATAGLLWHWTRDPNISFLSRNAAADWIVFPSAPIANMHPAVMLDTVFRRQFVVDPTAKTVRLRLRAARKFELTINGQPVAAPIHPNWKTFSTLDVTSNLHPGTNELQVRVYNDNGPPALWLAMDNGRVLLRSDPGWEASCAGSAWRHAASAATPKIPGPGNPLRERDGGTVPSVMVVWPYWVLFAFLSTMILCAGKYWQGRAGRADKSGTLSHRMGEGLLLIVGLLWAVLFLHNTMLLPRVLGFDGGHHFDYIQHVQENWTVPLPDKGYEMFQPPLYYTIAALVLSCVGVSATDAMAGTVLRTLGMCFGIVNLTLIFLCLRRLFPRNVGAQWVGLIVAAFLPMHLYLSHFTTNETLAATLATATVYLCLRVLQSPSPSIRQYVFLGICMGAACLTKVTDILLVPAVMIALFVCRRSRVERREKGALTPSLSQTHSQTLTRPPATLSHPMGEGRGEGPNLKSQISNLKSPPADGGNIQQPTSNIQRPTGESADMGTSCPHSVPSTLVYRLSTAFFCLAVCGWYYIWIWIHYGTPFVGNWDVATGFRWWQDPGYRTIADYTRFGAGLTHPAFSGFAGFADGIYSTLWGDALRGGTMNRLFEPPWQYPFMTAGYLMALVPTLLVLVGAAVIFWRWLTRPTAEHLLILAFSGSVAFAVFYMSLKVPSYAQAKAFYGLSAMACLCCFAAAGWETLTKRWKALQWILGIALLTLAMNSYVAMWICPRGATTLRLAGFYSVVDRRQDEGFSKLTDAVRIDPGDPKAELALGLAYYVVGRSSNALPHAERAVELGQNEAACHMLLGTILVDLGQSERALPEVRKAVELGPELDAGYQNLATQLENLGHPEDAIQAALHGLAIYPWNAVLHEILGRMLFLKGDFAGSARHCEYAASLQPGSADAQRSLALVLLQLNRDAEAIQHLRQSVRLSHGNSPEPLKDLAWLLATHPDPALRDGKEALRLAELAIQKSGKEDRNLLAILAAAYAECGRFPEAIAAVQQAIQNSPPTGDSNAATLKDMLQAFQANRPYRSGDGSSPRTP